MAIFLFFDRIILKFHRLVCKKKKNTHKTWLFLSVHSKKSEEYHGDGMHKSRNGKNKIKWKKTLSNLISRIQCSPIPHKSYLWRNMIPFLRNLNILGITFRSLLFLYTQWESLLLPNAMTYFQLHVSLVVCYSIYIHIVGVFNIENELGNPIEHKRNLR